ncbi:hypothetical protein CORT_0A05350 [Candida orthopsilosis Co 90-125]|uniref:Uncharacterized protein n=1 Tax=Candida orthopsilosis (strain 90-125) TaxID=1136231 RepID=H8WXX6_CANO9|nr:hypothetical protein CORT_0A05350 [Candida orthopsilosis Co 90-125]CCG20923.1 hypothetical protein CORT_0A05350 [Candida orthopsilosis Co 90-125]
MNIIKQAKAKNIFLLEKPVNTFIRRVGAEQSKNTGPLLKCIDVLINQYQPELMKKYSVEHTDDQYELKQRIWDKLKIRRTDQDPVLLKRMEFKPSDILYTREYNNFIKVLYPADDDPFQSKFTPFDLKHTATKYQNINHEHAFKRYSDLPKPAPQFLPPSILQIFIKKYVLKQRYFANRNILEGCLLRGDANGLSNAMRNENTRREEYRNSCQSVLNDLKQAGLELTQQEQVRMIYLTYFKDRHDIVSLVGDDKDLGYKRFTFEEYESILKTFGDRRDLLGVLLFLATRHDRFDIICDILPKVGLGSILGVENKNNLKLIDISLINLLGYFHTFIDRKGYIKYLANTIEELNQIPVITNEIVDGLIKVLTDLELVKHAEILFETAYFQTPPNNEEDEILAEWRYIYTKLKATTQDKSVFYKLSPNHLSFLTLFQGYCRKQSFDKIKQLMYVMDNLTNQKMSTKMYFEIFKGLKNRSNWTIDDLRFTLSRLLNQIDANKDNNDLNSLRILSGMGYLDSAALQGIWVGDYCARDASDTSLRLSNLLLDCIFMACVKHLHQIGETTRMGSIEKARSRWEKMVEPKKFGPHEAERLSFINKAVLMEIVTIMV